MANLDQPVTSAPIAPNRLPGRTRRKQQSIDIKKLLVYIGGFAVALACGAEVFRSSFGMRAFLAIAITTVLFTLLVQSPRQGTTLLLIYLGFLGGLRRWLIPSLGWPTNDPLLLVQPVLIIIYYVNLILGRKIHRDTPVSRSMTWLVAIMFIEIFNPLQGPISVGLGGVLFFMVPALWYSYGRNHITEDTLRHMILIVVIIGVLGLLYGMFQTFFGLNSAEMMWVNLHKKQYSGLAYNEGAVRAFSFFASIQEYAWVLGVTMIILWALFLRGMGVAVFFIPVLVVAVFLSSSRGLVMTTLAACVGLWAVQGRSPKSWFPRLSIAAVLAVIGLVWSLTRVQENTYSDKTQELINHQVNGLLNPTSDKYSTGGVHFAMFVSGITSGFTVPIGYGLGAATMAKVLQVHDNSGEIMGSTEIDISDTFMSFGFLGGILYLTIVIRVLSMAVSRWHRTRSTYSLVLLGILVVYLGHWLQGGAYLLSAFLWMCIGAMDTFDQQEKLAIQKAKGSNIAPQQAAT